MNYIPWKEIRADVRRIIREMLGLRDVAVTGWADGSVWNPNRPNYIRVTFQESEIEVWNDNVPQIKGLQVYLEGDPKVPGLLWAVRPRVKFTQDFPFVSINFHRNNHTFGSMDPVDVNIRQFMPLQPYVTSPFIVVVRGGWVEVGTEIVYFHGSQIDFNQYRPVGAGAKYVLVTMSQDAELVVTDGVKKGYSELTIYDIPALPDGHKRIFAVRLRNSQSRIEDKLVDPDLLDLRFGLSFASGSGGVEEAPIDGKIYGRSDESWIEVIPSGGTEGQVLAKISDNDFESGWIDPPAGGGGGGGGSVQTNYVGETTVGPNVETIAQYQMIFKKIVVPVKSILSSIEAYVHFNSGDVSSLSADIYTDIDNQPGLLLGISGQPGYVPNYNPLNVYMNQTPRWFGLSVPNIILEPGVYWISFMVGHQGWVVREYYHNGGSDLITSVDYPWSSDGDSYTFTNTGKSYSIRALLTSVGGGGDKSYTVEPALKPPTIPHPSNIEFSSYANDTDPTSVGLSWFNQGTSVSSIKGGVLSLTLGGALDNQRGLAIPNPFTSEDFTAWTGCDQPISRNDGPSRENHIGIIAIWGSLAVPTLTFISAGLSNEANDFVQARRQTNYTTFADSLDYIGVRFRSPLYLGIEWDHVNKRIRALASLDPTGTDVWKGTWDTTPSTPPDFIGVVSRDRNQSNLFSAKYRFLRFNWIPDFDPTTD